MQRSALRKTDQKESVDPIGCVGAALLLLILATMITALIRGGDAGALEVGSEDHDSDAPVAEAAGMTDGSLRNDGSAGHDPSLLTATETATRAALPTPTMYPTASATALPTRTTLPPTATATNTPAPSPTLLPTITSSPTIAPPPSSDRPPDPTATPFPEPTLQGTISWTVRVPILMYHYVSAPPEDANDYRVDLSVEPDQFRQQMAYLAENGYTTVDLYDLTMAIAGVANLPPKPVVITLDDGYRDAYDHAFPILQAYGLKATFFVITEFADQAYPTHLTWPMIEEMAAAGMRMEPHTKTHEDLRDRNRDFLVWQVLGSQETLAAHIGYTPRYLAYPGGRYDDRVLRVTRELDLWGAVTTAGGWWHGYDDRFEWRRLRVRNSTTLSEFDWLMTNGE